jgi:hypothetical protein
MCQATAIATTMKLDLFVAPAVEVGASFGFYVIW